MDEWEVELKGLLMFIGVSLLFFGSAFNLLALIFILAVIYIHEKGHALAAQYVDIEVEELSVGIGPAVFRRHRKGQTNTIFRAFPIGGYNIVEEDFDAKTTYGQKMLVAGGGILANMAVGIVGFAAFFFLWSVGGEAESTIVESIRSNLELTKTTSQFVVSDVEQFFLIMILMFSSLNILFGAVQMIPLTLFDGARLIEYSLSHWVSAYKRQYWEVQGNMVGKVWAGVSALIFIVWLFYLQ